MFWELHNSLLNALQIIAFKMSSHPHPPTQWMCLLLTTRCQNCAADIMLKVVIAVLLIEDYSGIYDGLVHLAHFGSCVIKLEFETVI